MATLPFDLPDTLLLTTGPSRDEWLREAESIARDEAPRSRPPFVWKRLRRCAA